MTRLGLAGYLVMRIVALAETGTRGLLGAVTGGVERRRAAKSGQVGQTIWMQTG